jgi:hypothetical protein
MMEISPADVPSALWSQSPFWSSIRRQAAARVFMTPDFSVDGRDGDH